MGFIVFLVALVLTESLIYGVGRFIRWIKCKKKYIADCEQEIRHLKALVEFYENISA